MQDPLSEDMDELRRLYLEKAALLQANRSNVVAQQSIEKSLTALRRTYDELKLVLKWLDQADKYYLEDQALEVVRLNDQAEEEMVAKSPFTAGILRSIPLTHLQSIERAEFDNLVTGSPWAPHEDKALLSGVQIAARRGLAIQYQSDREFNGDPIEASSSLSQDEVFQFAEPRTDDDQLDRIDWEIVASQISNRNKEECRTRWIKVNRKGVNSSTWRPSEIKDLRTIVEEEQEENVDWEQVAEKLNTKRTSYACFLAYCRSTPANSSKYSAEEDAQLISQYELFGGAWRIIALHHFAGRNKLQHYGRFSRSADPRIFKGKWSPEEDALVTNAVQQHGTKDWILISSRLIGRTSNQCRERWNVLRRMLEKGKANKPITWTAEADATILASLTADWCLNRGLKWADLAQQIGPDIREKQVRHRVATLRRSADETETRERIKIEKERQKAEKLEAQQEERRRKDEERLQAQQRRQEEKLQERIRREKLKAEQKRKREEAKFDPIKKKKPCTVEGCPKEFSTEGWRKRHVEREHGSGV